MVGSFFSNIRLQIETAKTQERQDSPLEKPTIENG